ncbi:MAG: hypothetical protein M3140_03965 [Actinomycetota bacterium]|nr:hypothetical protein [Actinomycetota bacterium]
MGALLAVTTCEIGGSEAPGLVPPKVLTELLRTAIVASAFASIAHRAGDVGVSHAVVLALITLRDSTTPRR